MVKGCFIPFCKTAYKYNQSSDQKYSLFKAPNDDVMLEKWRQSIPMRERELNKQDRICEKHFEQRCVIPRFQQVRNGDFYQDHIRPKLRPDAIPTIFPDTDPKGRPLRFKEKTTLNELSVLNANIALLLPKVTVNENDCVPVCYKCLIQKCSAHIIYCKR